MKLQRSALGVFFIVSLGCSGELRPLNSVEGAGQGGAGGEPSVAGAGAGGSAGGGASGAAGSGGASGSAGAGASGADAGTGGAGAPSTGGESGGSSAGTGGGAGAGSGGSAGEPALPVGAPCNASTGTGCDARQFCIDVQLDECDADSGTDCAGYCANAVPRRDLLATCHDGFCPEETTCFPDPAEPERAFCLEATTACDSSTPCAAGFVCDPSGNCVPERVACSGAVLCPINVAACPPGYVHSVIDDCYGPCVPLETCGCTRDADCSASASCDRLAGRCVVPAAPEPRCLVPYEGGRCDARFLVFAFGNGGCQEREHGGCPTNDNLFSTLEECRARCEGEPLPNGCADGEVVARICLACGPAGGCGYQGLACAQPCDDTTECATQGFRCGGGFCQAALCD
jgi:hypothetical protein